MCFIEVLTQVLMEVDNARDLKLIAENLQRKFDLLVTEVKNTLAVNNVDMNDVKKFIISPKLHSIHIEEEQKNGTISTKTSWNSRYG